MAALSIGLTGGVASGKSLVAETFMSLGAPVLDADQVARDVVVPGSAPLAEIVRAFGAGYLQPDGSLDRGKLRQRVFANPAELKRLEQITHPAIRAKLVEWRDRQTAPYCVLSVAILIEARMGALVDRVLVVDVAPEIQLRRLKARDGIAETLARQMLAAQASREVRLQNADDVLTNEGSPDDLRGAVRRLHSRYLELAHGGPAVSAQR